jgi:hypothetical protein
VLIGLSYLVSSTAQYKIFNNTYYEQEEKYLGIYDISDIRQSFKSEYLMNP